jgi:hypothetical protein
MTKRAVVKRRAKTSTKAGQHHDDHVDGCDLDFRASEATPDHELPAAKGGVEATRTGRRKKAKVGKRGRSVRR